MGAKKKIDTSFVNTSVDDLQSGMHGYNDMNVLRAALKIVVRRGEKTKATIIRRKIAKLEKEGAK